jgi:hypothetical protein
MTDYGKIHTDGSLSGGQPVFITKKAHTMVLEVLAEWGLEPVTSTPQQLTVATTEALCRAIEQHEAFKQKVSDIASAYNKMAFTVTEMEPHDVSNYRLIIGFEKSADASMCHDRLVSLLDFVNPKPKPDPLVDVAKSLGVYNTAAQHWAGDVSAALDALGFEIREKGQ